MEELFHDKMIDKFETRRTRLREQILYANMVSWPALGVAIGLWIRYRKTNQYTWTQFHAAMISIGTSLYGSHCQVQHDTIGTMRRAIDSAAIYEKRVAAAADPKSPKEYPLSAGEMETIRLAMIRDTNRLCEEGGEFVGLSTARKIWSQLMLGHGHVVQPRHWHYQYAFFVHPTGIYTACSSPAPKNLAITNYFGENQSLAQMVAFY